MFIFSHNPYRILYDVLFRARWVKTWLMSESSYVCPPPLTPTLDQWHQATGRQHCRVEPKYSNCTLESSNQLQPFGLQHVATS